MFQLFLTAPIQKTEKCTYYTRLFLAVSMRLSIAWW